MGGLKKVKTAVVGCGMISTIYIKNLVNLFSIIDLVAVCDLHEEAAKVRATQFKVPRIMTLEEICASDEIELVVNLTAAGSHYDIVKKLLLAGKNVYTEKMLCFDLEQGKELLRIAKEKGLYLGAAPDTFLGAGLQTARKILDSGLIGTPTSVLAAINRNQMRNSEVFRAIRSTGGAFPYDVGVYYVSAMLALLGPVKKVSGFTVEAGTYTGKYLWNDNYGQEWKLEGSNLQAGSLLFENGVLGSVHFNGMSINAEQPVLNIYGTEGILELGDPGGFNGDVILVRNSGEKTKIPFTHGFSGTPLYGEPTPFDWGGHRGVGVAEMAWSMRLGRPNRASKELALHTLELIKGIDEACKKNGVYEMTTTFDRPAPLPSGFLSEEGGMRSDAEVALSI